MTKHAGLSEFFESYPDVGARASALGVNEQELSNWAERAIAVDGKSRAGRIGTLVFWGVIGVLLAARFFVIDPAKLRPAETSSPAAVSQSASGR